MRACVRACVCVYVFVMHAYTIEPIPINDISMESLDTEDGS